MGQPVMPVVPAGLADNAGIVAARGEQEGYVGIGQPHDLEYRMPGRDMVELGAHGKDRHANIGQCHRATIHLHAAFGEIVVQEQLAQVFAVHAIGHAGLVGIPGHQVDHAAAFADDIVVHHLRPDQVVGAQQLEGAGHLLGIQVTLLPHHVFQESHLVFVDEQRQFAGFREIGLCRQQGQAGQALVAVARHGSSGYRQQRAAQAIAHAVDFPFRADRRHGIQRRHHAQFSVIVETQLAVVVIGILPRHHEHGMAALDQVAHQRVPR